jgi:hypothetical protein
MLISRHGRNVLQKLIGSNTAQGLNDNPSYSDRENAPDEEVSSKKQGIYSHIEARYMEPKKVIKRGNSFNTSFQQPRR